MLGGDWLSTWGHTLELSDIAHVFLTWPGSNCIFGDTLTTDLAIGLSQGNELSSADIQVSYDTTFYLSGENEVRVDCYDWSKEMGYWDNFRVSVITDEFESWLNSNY